MKRVPIYIIDESDFGPDKPALPVGALIKVRAKERYDVTSRNDVGGTLSVPPGTYTVRIVRQWWDYETGQHYACMLTKQDDVDILAGAAKTPYGPKAKDVDPTMVFCCGDAVVEVVKKR